MKVIVKRYLEVSLIGRIFVGLIIGAIIGIAAPGATVVGLLGDIFVGALKAIAPVLVFVLVLSAWTSDLAE